MSSASARLCHHALERAEVLAAQIYGELDFAWYLRERMRFRIGIELAHGEYQIAACFAHGFPFAVEQIAELCRGKYRVAAIFVRHGA